MRAEVKCVTGNGKTRAPQQVVMFYSLYCGRGSSIETGKTLRVIAIASEHVLGANDEIQKLGTWDAA